jgi:hypothetical protein
MGLVVDIPETDKPLLSEQQPIDGVGGFQLLMEQESLDNWTDIVPGVRAKAEAIVQQIGDEKPEFPVVRVEEGWSGSGRLWDGECLKVLAEQLSEREPVAHLGHIKEEDFATQFPEPQTVWLGATTKQEPSKLKDRLGQMVTVFYAKGYNLPGAKIRTYLKTKAVKGVSWVAFGSETRVPGRGVAVNAKSIDLRALDWARKLSEGMPSSEVVALASEMKGVTVGDKALSQVTPDEFKQENPNGFALLVSEAQAEQKELLTEMEGKVEDAKKDQTLLSQIREKLGIDADADPLAAIVSLVTKLGEEAKGIVSAEVDKILEKKLPGKDNAEKRALVRRLMPLMEMESKVAEKNDGEEAVKLISEMTDAAFDKDEDVKRLLAEQQPPNVRRREEVRGGTDDDATKDNQYVQSSGRQLIA